MPLRYQVLGHPFRDNALYLRVETGKKNHCYLFDCGEKCLDPLSNKTLSEIDHLFISHFHMDHISGFDRFFRNNYKRPKAVSLSGPEETIRIMKHRFNGFIWNLVDGQPGEWRINELRTRSIRKAVFYPADRFSKIHHRHTIKSSGLLIENKDLIIRYMILDHKTPVAGFIVREKAKWNINKTALDAMRLKEGAWLERLKNLAVSDSEEIDFPELTRTISVGELREQLLIENPGQVLVYLTDFIFSESILEKLSLDIPRKAILICESQYLTEDLDLAKANYHLTAMQAAKIARRIEAEKLILIHLSPRYGGDRLDQFLTEARELFPNTFLPDEWTREKSSDNY